MPHRVRHSGSGKSFGITQVARILGTNEKIEELNFNVSQGNSPDYRVNALHRVRDHAIQGKVPLVVFDEFDSKFGSQNLGWLKYFLAPLQEGIFADGLFTHDMGRPFSFSQGSGWAANSQTPIRILHLALLSRRVASNAASNKSFEPTALGVSRINFGRRSHSFNAPQFQLLFDMGASPSPMPSGSAGWVPSWRSGKFLSLRAMVTRATSSGS